MAQNKRKKVLYLITKGTWGGAQRYVYDLATHLPKEQYEPLLAYGHAGKLSQDIQAAGVRALHLPSLDRDIAFFSDVRSFFEIWRTLRAERPDVLHLNSSKAAALGALAGRLTGTKNIVFTVHGWPFGEKRNFFSKILIWKISWLTALLSHHVICVSDHDLGLAKKMPFIGKKSVRIYNGIAPMQFGLGDIIRNAFPSGVKITGTIGELTKNKNQRALIEEAAHKPDMYVALVGEGEDRALLERLIKEQGLESRVQLFGYVPSQEALKGFDTFALPSLKEGLPYVLLEAKQASLPIVANRVGGVGEALDKNVSEFSLERMVDQTMGLYTP